MSSMIERVARALAKADGDPAVLFDYYLEHARAAIEAMRELSGDPGPRYSAGEYSRRTQEAMVDDALGQATVDQ